MVDFRGADDSSAAEAAASLAGDASFLASSFLAAGAGAAGLASSLPPNFPANLAFCYP